MRTDVRRCESRSAQVQDPDRYDIKRDNRGHVGWGYGVHACVGRVLALLEAEALLGAIVQHVERFESAGPVEPWMTTIGHGPAKLPVKLFAATNSCPHTSPPFLARHS